jgi:hypothetical protein
MMEGSRGGVCPVLSCPGGKDLSLGLVCPGWEEWALAKDVGTSPKSRGFGGRGGRLVQQETGVRAQPAAAAPGSAASPPVCGGRCLMHPSSSCCRDFFPRLSEEVKEA